MQDAKFDGREKRKQHQYERRVPQCTEILICDVNVHLNVRVPHLLFLEDDHVVSFFVPTLDQQALKIQHFDYANLCLNMCTNTSVKCCSTILMEINAHKNTSTNPII